MTDLEAFTEYLNVTRTIGIFPYGPIECRSRTAYSVYRSRKHCIFITDLGTAKKPWRTQNLAVLTTPRETDAASQHEDLVGYAH